VNGDRSAGRAKKALAWLCQTYPNHEFLFTDVREPLKIGTERLPISEAVVRIVIGQMLSRSAAQAIYARCVSRVYALGAQGTWALGATELRGCGVSQRKADAIARFGAAYAATPSRFDAWYKLDQGGLNAAIRGQWGMSNWTADMLSIFYIGHEDVFPSTDASIKRALNFLDSCATGEKTLDPSRAKPYRSYLALYLWNALDTDLLRKCAD
jgi:DNA-3-methyladenine glycosylase II